MSTQKGIAHLALIVLVVFGIAIGLYLVQTKTDLFPSAQFMSAPVPQTAFHLTAEYPTDPATPPQKGRLEREWFYPGEKVSVEVAVSSDIDAANTFSAVVNFPNDLLEVMSVQKGDQGGSIALDNPVQDTFTQEQSSGGVTQTIPSANLPSNRVCAQVITKACILEQVICVRAPCPPQQICKEFPTPCDVPAGWEIEDQNLKGSRSCSWDTINPEGPCPKGYYCKSRSTCSEGGACTQVMGGDCYPDPSPVPSVSCRPRPACLDSEPRCLMPETSDMCPPAPRTVEDYFIRFWLPDTGFNNETGKIILSGGVSGQGILTVPPSKPIMATIIFKAKKAGEVNLQIAEESMILRNSDSSNILVNRNNLTIQIQDPAKPVVKGDLDGDGVVGYKDFSMLLSKWGTDDKIADINGDGKVSIFDFSILLTNWTGRKK